MTLRQSLIGTAIGATILALSGMCASAAIVCTGNVCWHTREIYTYPPEARVVVHRDNWNWGPSEHYTWREHEGAGYWKGDSWTTIEERR